MKEYVSPTLAVLQFHSEDVLAYSIGNPGDDEVETPVIPFNLPKVDLG